ncbi:MAG: group II intron reverse transcriptase/maturase, partial [Deltaproteobacteria bacterium]|nr:group II intron reverse transcriptase/maturase [Deltaproteobacteria bacterium]
ERILSRENMRQAWKRVKANKGAPGIDNMSIKEFPDFARENWNPIRESLADGSYQPLPVKRVEIPKQSGGTRPLGIPTVTDRLIQQAIAQVLMPIFDSEFSDASYGFRPGRSAHDAVYKVREYIKEGFRIAVDMDLSKFFDTVNHDVLMHRVARKIKDKRVLALIGKFLRAFTFKGTKIRWSDKAYHQFRWRIKRLTGRFEAKRKRRARSLRERPTGAVTWFVSMEYRMMKLAQYLRGWMNYFGISEYYSPIPEIDHWLRRRVRMCHWKQWRYVRTRVRNLLKMGTHPNVAIPMSFSRK